MIRFPMLAPKTILTEFEDTYASNIGVAYCMLDSLVKPAQEIGERGGMTGGVPPQDTAILHEQQK